MRKINYTIVIIIFWIAIAAISSCKNKTATKNEDVQLSDQIPATVTDIDGNVYHTVKIGSQIWFVENLKTSRFRDGSPIPEIKDRMAWAKIASTFYSTEVARANGSPMAHTPAWCYYQNNENNNSVYGKLYNWYTVDDTRKICPVGWHVPTDIEFQVLSEYLGGDDMAGSKLKATQLWQAPVKGGGDANDNSSGFTALPGNLRNDAGEFGGNRPTGVSGHFWCSTRLLSNSAWIN